MSDFLHWLRSPVGLASAGAALVILAFIFIERNKANQQQAQPQSAVETASVPPLEMSNGTIPASIPGGPMDNDGADLPPTTTSAAPASTQQQQPLLYTTKAGDTLSSIQYIYKQWGDNTIKARNPVVAGYGYFDKLPAGLVLQVGYQ